MKIVLYGDSITDMGRDRTSDFGLYSYGVGYVNAITGQLMNEQPLKYEIYNRGISGDRVVDLYARIKCDVWNLQPDVLSVLIGVNDIWHELADCHNGVDVVRYEKVYRMLIEDTLERLPDIKIILCEPFMLKGTVTEGHYEDFLKIKEYAKVVKSLAKEYNLYFLPLQASLDEAASRNGAKNYLIDGVHPTLAGAKLIADEWLKLFKEKIED